MPPPVNLCGCPAASEREREGGRGRETFLGQCAIGQVAGVVRRRARDGEVMRRRRPSCHAHSRGELADAPMHTDAMPHQLAPIPPSPLPIKHRPKSPNPS
jgi:hypothetical protein